MQLTKTRTEDAQLNMPGIPRPVRMEAIVSFHSVNPGQQVLYLGTLRGGPRPGAQGIVSSVLRRSAVVDMGADGTWHVPYYLLALPQAA
ncbi:MAG: hypothetical protein IH956_05290 [Chloroflexi bacterium]|nr:hypothetical protein [Chloroflexota bacterium]